jgi:ferredoxin
MRLKGFETIDLQNLIRRMPRLQGGQRAAAEIHSATAPAGVVNAHARRCARVFAITDDGYAEVQVPEVPDGQEDAAREAIECCPEQAISEGD